MEGSNDSPKYRQYIENIAANVLTSEQPPGLQRSRYHGHDLSPDSPSGDDDSMLTFINRQTADKPDSANIDSRLLVAFGDNEDDQSNVDQHMQSANENSTEAHSHHYKTNNYYLKGTKLDAKNVCMFCDKSFLYPGSLGRHLDRKKGTEGHPEDVISKLRANVRRVGDVENSKRRAKERLRRYRSKEEVKERRRIQRKKQYAESKTRKRLSDLDTEISPSVTLTVEENISYPKLVIFNLPPAKWPTGLPSNTTYSELSKAITTEELQQKLSAAKASWENLDELSKLRLWSNEYHDALREILGELTLKEYLKERNQP